jgi:hypothetical protein
MGVEDAKYDDPKYKLKRDNNGLILTEVLN